MNKDLYQILNVEKNATKEEIKKKYRELAKQHHPDKGGDAEKFKEVGESYAILSDSKKREQYDRFGYVGNKQGQEFHMNMDDIFNFHNFDDIFEQRTQRSNFNQNRGSNLRIKIKLNLKEILLGCEKKIKLNKFVKCNNCKGYGGENQMTCPNCKGKGMLINVQQTILGQMRQVSTCFTCDGTGKIIKDKCHFCSGEGIIRKEEYFSIEIPKGVEKGMQLNISANGNCGRKNGTNGDLLILIEEIKDNILVRDGYNILYDLNIDMVDACLGTNMEIPTILNNVKINIEPGTQPGKILKLKGRGLPNINDGQFGDQLIKINVIIPKELTIEEKELLGKLKLSKNFVNIS